jgi:hypothetical protein
MTEPVANGNGAQTVDHGEVLRANGFLAIRSQLNTVAEAVASQLPPVGAIDAAIAYFEETRDKADVPLPPDQVDELDVQLGMFRMLRTAAGELEEIRTRAEARAKLRGSTAAVPRGRRG